MGFLTLLDFLGQLGGLIVTIVAATGLVALLLAALLAGGSVVVFDRRRSNCLAYALRKWLSEGGYLVFLWSRWTGLPHCVHSFDMKHFTEFMPIDPKRRRLVPPLIFLGEVREWTPSDTRA